MISDRPIFIVGAPRSGTTLLRSLLDAHPDIFCPEWETGVFIALDGLLNGDIRKVLAQQDNFPLQRADLVDWARGCVQDLFGRFAEKCGKTRWAEKTPAHALHVGLIHEVFPQAQLVHIIRNGHDVVKSLKNRSWAPAGWLRGIRWCTHTWIDCVRGARTAADGLPGGLYHEVRYEPLIAEPEPAVRALCEFLGEPFAPQMLEFHRPQSNTWQSEARPLQSKPLGQYGELGVLERLVFNRLAGPLMRELGYW